MALYNAKSNVKELASDVRIQPPLVVKVAECMALTNLVRLYKAQTIRSIGMVREPKNRLQIIKKHYCGCTCLRKSVITLRCFPQERLELVDLSRLAGSL
jgi:hypothetical protein